MCAYISVYTYINKYIYIYTHIYIYIDVGGYEYRYMNIIFMLSQWEVLFRAAAVITWGGGGSYMHLRSICFLILAA